MNDIYKIGSKLLTDGRGSVHKRFIIDVCRQIVIRKDCGHGVVLVTSGAIQGDSTKTRSENLRAAVGQSRLMRLYDQYVSDFGYETAQILCTYKDLENKDSCFAHTVQEGMSDPGVVVILNYNDPVDNREIEALHQYADNDQLLLRVSLMCQIDMAFIAIYEDGILDSAGKVIHEIRSNDFEKIQTFIREGNELGHGSMGMKTKTDVAFELAANGIYTALIPGQEKDFILRAVNKEKNFGTVFI